MGADNQQERPPLLRFAKQNGGGIFRDYTPDSPKGEEDIVRTA